MVCPWLRSLFVSATGQIVAFGAATGLEDIPVSVQTATKRHILDTMGLMLAGSTTEGCRLTQSLFHELGGAHQATAIGTGRRLSILQAAYANGVSDSSSSRLAALTACNTANEDPIGRS